jgi:hypothetical protein
MGSSKAAQDKGYHAAWNAPHKVNPPLASGYPGREMEDDVKEAWKVLGVLILTVSLGLALSPPHSEAKPGPVVGQRNAVVYLDLRTGKTTPLNKDDGQHQFEGVPQQEQADLGSAADGEYLLEGLLAHRWLVAEVLWLDQRRQRALVVLSK